MSCFAERLRKFVGDAKFNELLDSLPDIKSRGKLRFWQETLLERFEKETGIAAPQPLAMFIKEMVDFESAQEKSIRDTFTGAEKEKINASVSDFDKVIDFLINNKNRVLGSRWQGDKEGYHTQLAEPIDFTAVCKLFEFGEDIDISRRHQYIRTKRDWLEIRYEGPGEKL